VFGHRFFAIYNQKMEAAPYRLDSPDSTNAPSAAPLRNTVGSPAAQSAMGLYAALTLGAVVSLGFLFAHDVSQHLAQRATGGYYDKDGEDLADPEYERAEQVWANGDHLEAVRLMREYLRKNPRQVHVSLRIAEIYEKDLNNALAAALEYEEILTKKLNPERWGWAAVHLCNLYYRMEQPAKAETLLHRIVNEYGETSAAKKARERLGLIEAVAEAPPVEAAPAPEETQQSPQLKLPPGFRPKKG
jgi:hypothetical protein